MYTFCPSEGIKAAMRLADELALVSSFIRVNSCMISEKMLITVILLGHTGMEFFAPILFFHETI